ncbi:hypothetical protein G7051_08005 [Dysgonomonas sp. HDW5B]|uniref:hypothetical protein n=1 Tax=Dysgonomonas sp. HDW5B TaxID=2714927 RepID=UPI001409528D|nr:hypothetical protein [Dysgonomonas sp. HDW5B]QIK54286.1 hypothetical protein G7051_08005 [Dysgonomonas sp. HDW5B]
MFEKHEELKLTYQELKEIEGYENVTEEEATEIIDIVSMLSVMVYNTCKNKKVKNTGYE